jgi:hypothetical protein
VGHIHGDETQADLIRDSRGIPAHASRRGERGCDVPLRRDERGFVVVPLDGEFVVVSTELRHGHGFSLADSAVAATAIRERCPVVSDDLHFKEIEGAVNNLVTMRLRH